MAAWISRFRLPATLGVIATNKWGFGGALLLSGVSAIFQGSIVATLLAIASAAAILLALQSKRVEAKGATAADEDNTGVVWASSEPRLQSPSAQPIMEPVWRVRSAPLRYALFALGVAMLFTSLLLAVSAIRHQQAWPQQVLAHLEAIRAGQETQATKDDLNDIKNDILARLGEKQLRAEGEPEPWSPELIERARILLNRGDNEQQAVAAIALGEHEKADALLQRLKEDPLAEAFRVLTLEGDNWYRAGEYDRAIEPFEMAMTLRPNDHTARNNVAIAHSQARLGDIAAHRRRAIEVLRGSLEIVPTGTADWAMTQNNLGAAWRSMPTGHRAENLRNAIKAFEAALEVYTREAHPVDWATTQNNLGNAWANMPTGDRAQNLRGAIELYEAAMEVFTREAYPVNWAATQNNLGYAWWNMPTGNRVQNLRRAIAAYEAALTVRTRESRPVEWAMTQNNLGNAWQRIPTGDRAENLRRAIEAYEAALTVWAREAHPVDWAATQNYLGIAWRNMPTGDRALNLNRAIEAYEAALTVYTREAHPVDWATAQNNLGNAWAGMPTGDRAENLRSAIEAYEAALTVYTREAHPVEWAMTRHNQGITFADLAAAPGEDRCALLRRAVACGKGALLVSTPDAFPDDHRSTMHNLEIYHRAYESFGCVPPFDDIPPAE